MSRESIDAELEKEGTVAEDQRKRGYYYDDAFGYEPYRPDEAEPASSCDDESESDATDANDGA